MDVAIITLEDGDSAVTAYRTKASSSLISAGGPGSKLETSALQGTDIDVINISSAPGSADLIVSPSRSAEPSTAIAATRRRHEPSSTPLKTAGSPSRDLRTLHKRNQLIPTPPNSFDKDGTPMKGPWK